jgi:hypothetical protein
VTAGEGDDEHGDNREPPPMGTARVHHTFNLAAEGNLADRRQDEGTRREGAA